MNVAFRMVFLAAACVAAPPAQALREQPIVLVNSYPPGGPSELAGNTAANKVLNIMHSFAVPSLTDVLADRASLGMSVALDRIVTVQRRSRGRSILGARYVAGSAPDGRTLLLTSSLKMVTYARLYDLPYAPLRDFAPVAAVGRMPVVVIAAADGGPESTQAFVAAARAAPGRLNYGSSGDFRTGHLAGELFCRRWAAASSACSPLRIRRALKTSRRCRPSRRPECANSRPQAGSASLPPAERPATSSCN